MTENIIFPRDFIHPKFIGGAWLDFHRHWSLEDKNMLSAAIDLGISPSQAANTIGRPPKTLAVKALELGLKLSRPWRKLVYRYKIRSSKDAALEYPYIIHPSERHNELLAVNRMVSRSFPGREDVCQNIMLAIWQSKTSIAELINEPQALRLFLKEFRRLNYEKGGYGVESMDITLHSEDGISKYDNANYQRSLANHDDQFLEDLIFGQRSKGYNMDFSSHLIDQITYDEEEIGIPAALWMHAENIR